MRSDDHVSSAQDIISLAYVLAHEVPDFQKQTRRVEHSWDVSRFCDKISIANIYLALKENASQFALTTEVSDSVMERTTSSFEIRAKPVRRSGDV